MASDRKPKNPDKARLHVNFLLQKKINILVATFPVACPFTSLTFGVLRTIFFRKNNNRRRRKCFAKTEFKFFEKNLYNFFKKDFFLQRIYDII